MNTFLQGCCYIPPDDDNVPTIFESSTYATISSTTNMLNPMNTYKFSNYLQLKHTIKEDDMLQFHRVAKARSAKICVKSSHNSSINNSFTKMDATCNNNISSASEENTINYGQTVIPTVSQNPSVQSSSRTLESNLIGAVYNPDWWQNFCSEDTSSYEPKSPQLPSSSKNQLLDRLSACLWKCSLGCQQIPTLNT